MESNQKNLKEIYGTERVFIYEKDKSYSIGIIIEENLDFVIINADGKGKTAIPKTEILEIAPERKRGDVR